MTRWKSQAFDSEKVGRYSIAAMLMYCMSAYLYWPLCVLFRFVELKLWISLIGFGGGLLVLITTGILKRAENLGSNFMRWVAIVADDTVNWNSKQQEPVTRQVWIRLNQSLQWPPWEQKKVAIVRGGRCSEVSNKSQCNDFLSTRTKKSGCCREMATNRGSTVLFKKAGTFYTMYSFHFFFKLNISL